MRDAWQTAGTALLLTALAGCGSDGPGRLGLSGRVVYAGRPAAAGIIVFQPDDSKGNNGPGGVADIKNGTYRTRPAMGAVSGPQLARITLGDGVGADPYMNPHGKVVATLVVPVDVPDRGGTLDLDLDPPAKK